MADWVHTFKGAVLASEYDFASHMNSHMYVSRFDQATWFLLHAIGMTPASMKQKNLRVAIVRQNYQFLEELRGGELVEIKSGFLAVGEKYFRFIHQMYNDETGKMVATCDSVAVQASLESGKSVPMTAELQEKAKRHLVTTNVPLDETSRLSRRPSKSRGSRSLAGPSSARDGTCTADLAGAPKGAPFKSIPGKLYPKSPWPVAITTEAHSSFVSRLRCVVAIGMGTWMNTPCCRPTIMSVLPAMAA